MNFIKYTTRRAAAGILVKQSRRITLGKIFVILLIVFIIIAGLIYVTSRPGKTRSVWNNIKSGDSLFVESIHGMNFYKKGRIKLNEYQIAQEKYARNDTVSFIWKNSIPEKTFYLNKTTFIGIYVGKDSSVTKAGESNSHRWIQIIPNRIFTLSDEWNNSTTDILAIAPLSKEWYVKATDVTLINTDSLLAISK